MDGVMMFPELVSSQAAHVYFCAIIETFGLIPDIWAAIYCCGTQVEGS